MSKSAPTREKQSTQAEVSKQAPVLGRMQYVPGFLVRRLSKQFVMTWDSVFAGFDIQITPVQAGILVLIDENPGISQAEVAHILDVEGPTLVKSISKLLEAGLITKKERPSDRRSYSLHLSQNTKPALQEIEVRLKRHDDKVLAALSEKERKVFIALLQRILASNMPSKAWGLDHLDSNNPM